MSHTDFDKCTCLGLCHVGGEETKPPVEAGRLVEKLPGLALQRPPVRRQLLQRLHRLLGEGAESALQRVHVKPEDECEIEFQNNWGYFFSPYIQSWAKERALGCVNSPPAARGSQEAGFTQPRAHSFAQPCKGTDVHDK